MNVAAKPQSTFKLEAVHPNPSQAHKMPYAPAIKIVGACDLMFLSGATSSPLYHNHPHQEQRKVHRGAILQNRFLMIHGGASDSTGRIPVSPFNGNVGECARSGRFHWRSRGQRRRGMVLKLPVR